MNHSDYNPEGRKLTYKQHMALMKQQQEKLEARKRMNGGVEKPWLCEKCSKSRYKLRAVDGQLIRICKECSDEKVF